MSLRAAEAVSIRQSSKSLKGVNPGIWPESSQHRNPEPNSQLNHRVGDRSQCDMKGHENWYSMCGATYNSPQGRSLEYSNEHQQDGLKTGGTRSMGRFLGQGTETWEESTSLRSKIAGRGSTISCAVMQKMRS